MVRNFKPYKKEYDYSYTLGVFLTIELLLNKPYQVICVVADTASEKNGGLTKIKDLCNSYNIPFEINDKIIERLSTKENCYVIGFFRKYDPGLDMNSNHVVLVNPMDSGNLGTIMRTGLGFNFCNLAIIRPSVDIFDPRTIRASMGAIFSMKFSYFNSFIEYTSNFPKRNLYPFMLNAKEELHHAAIMKKEPYSLIFGNESSGLTDEFSAVGTNIIIPHSDRIDSLNLSIAVGIAVYEFSKSY